MQLDEFALFSKLRRNANELNSKTVSSKISRVVNDKITKRLRQAFSFIKSLGSKMVWITKISWI